MKNRQHLIIVICCHHHDLQNNLELKFVHGISPHFFHLATVQ